MIKLELRNTKTQKSVFVDTRGAVFGREGGDADIKLADQGVSKKHARIYARKGEWFLEDLNSANGTYVDSQRISQVVPLEPGSSFSLSRQQFEVVQIVEDEPEVTQAPRQEMLPADDEGADATGESDDGGGRDESDDRGDEPAEDEEFQETVPPNPQPPPSRRPEARGGSQAAVPSPRRMAPARTAARQEQEIEADEAPAGFDIGYFMKAVPKALGYYLAAIPLMLVNPIGFVRKGIDQQKVPAMGTMQLIAYAFPPLLAQALLVFLGALLLQIRAGAVSIGGILPIGPLIGAVVGAVVSGFVWHPVLNWIISKLGGDSDAKSRSNMFTMAMTATALLGVPTLVTGIVSFIPLTILGLVPVLVQAVFSLAMLFVYYSWFKHFGVMKWFQYGLLAIAGLTVLGVVGGSVDVIKATLSGGGSSSGVEMASGSGDAVSDEEIPEEWKSALAAAEASGNPEMIERVREQMKNAIAAMKSAQQQQSAAQETAQAARQTAQAVAETMNAKAPDEAKVQPAAAQTEPKVEVAAAKKEAVKLDMPPPPVAAKVAPVRGMAYPDYKKKLTAIETAISDDPTLLRRVDGLLPLYEDLYKARYEAEQRVGAAQRKSERWQSPVNAHLKDAEVYKETQELVGRVHSKMFPQ